MDLRGGQADLADATDDRVEQHGCLPDPPCQRRAVDLDALRSHYLGLAVKRQMMVELGDDDMGQRAEGRLAPRNGLYRRGRLHDLLAGSAAILGADGPNDAPLHQHGIEHLVAILPQRPQRAAAVRTGATALLGLRSAEHTSELQSLMRSSYAVFGLNTQTIS